MDPAFPSDQEEALEKTLHTTPHRAEKPESLECYVAESGRSWQLGKLLARKQQVAD